MKKILLGFFAGLAFAPVITALYNILESKTTLVCNKINIETNKMAADHEKEMLADQPLTPQIGFDLSSGCEDYDEDEE